RDLHLTALPLGRRIVDLRERVAPESVRAEDDELVPRHAHDDGAGPERGLARPGLDADEHEEDQAERGAPSPHADMGVQERCPRSSPFLQLESDLAARWATT